MQPRAEAIPRRALTRGYRRGAATNFTRRMSEYERLTMEEGDHDDRRYRQRTLQRWRLSMLLAFCSGVMVTMVAYPRLQPCPDLQAVARAAAARCPACPAYTPPDTNAIVSKAVEQAVSHCPSCPKCPDFPGCPACPSGSGSPQSPSCPSCELKCPTVRRADHFAPRHVC